MNDETKDPALPLPTEAAVPADPAVLVPEAAATANAAPLAENAAPADASSVDAKPPEAMPVIFNTASVTPTPAAAPPPGGGVLALLRSGAVMIGMLGIGYFILTELGLMKPFAKGGASASPDAVMIQMQREAYEAAAKTSAPEPVRRPPPSYPAPTITVTAAMIGDGKAFPPPLAPLGSASAKPGGKKGALDEAQTLDAARAAIAKGDSTKALVILDGHDRDFAAGLMNPDAKVLRIEALARTGEDARAKEMAEGFLADFPHSPLAPRTRGLLDAINNKMAAAQAPPK